MKLQLVIGFFVLLFCFPSAANFMQKFKTDYLELKYHLNEGQTGEAKQLISNWESELNDKALNSLTKSQKKSLQNDLTKAKRALALNGMLEPCLKEKKDKRNMIQQLTQGSFLEDCNCDLPEGLLSDTQKDKKGNLQGISKLASRDALLEDSVSEGILNASVAMMKYDLMFLQQEEAPEYYLKEICSSCSSQQKEKLLEDLKIIIHKTKEDIESGELDSFNFESAYEELDSRTRSLNKSISTIYDQMEESANKRIREPLAKREKKKEQQYRFYEQKYYQFISDELGSLLITTKGRALVGDLKVFADINKTTRGKIIRTERHTSARPHCFGEDQSTSSCREKQKSAYQKMISEAKRQVKEHAKELLLSENRNITEQLKRNPLAVGKALVTHPQVFEDICAAIAKISTEDQRRDQIEKRTNQALTALSIGSMVLGGAGVIMKASSTAAKVILAKTVKSSVQIGMLSSAGNISLFHSQIKSLEKENKQVRNAIMAQSVTPSEYKRAMELDSELSRVEMGRLLTAFEFLPLGWIMKLRKARLLDKTGNIAGGLNLSRVAKNAKSLTKLEQRSLNSISKKYPELKNDVDSFVISISNFKSLKERKEWLRQLQGMRDEPEKIKELLREVREALSCHI